MALISTPSPRDPLWSLADFAEIRAIQSIDKGFSETEFLQDLNRLGDHSRAAGPDFGEKSYETATASAFQQISDRIECMSSGDAYPFELRSHDVSLLELKASWPAPAHYVYVFLLLSTYLNMNTHKKFKYEGSNDDATCLFETLSKEAICNYLDCCGHYAGGFVFGTGEKVESDDNPDANAAVFSAKIERLTTEVGDGGSFRNKLQVNVRAQDDGIDIVAWKGFPDKRRSKLIVLGQCKTGSSWGDEQVSRISYQSLETKWLTDTFEYKPLIVFTCTMQADRDMWAKAGTKGTVLVLDRSRLLAQCRFSEATLARCKAYVCEKLGLDGQ